MLWNWQLPNWPHFIYDPSSLVSLEKTFLQGAGGSFAVLKHLDDQQKKKFIVEILCAEGLNSAEIEGEILERESLQSSIQRHFGLSVEKRILPPKEQGMGNLMWSMYSTYDQILTHEMLYEWHKLLMGAESTISDKGKYRTHKDPMQIVSGRYDRYQVYFEAPPSSKVYEEMTEFIQWFNDSKNEESSLARAAIAHVYFESIHPFEDGNGRIGRALVEKALSQSLGQPTLIAISQVINRRKKEYYKALGACNKTLDIGKWVVFFAGVIVQSQEESLDLIHFLMAKSKLMGDLTGKINERQEKVLLRMFAEGIRGFSGGLSAENYISITKTSRATATRDLSDLVKKRALYKTGKLRHTRYWLNL
ncbi:MAG: Adenosine monophosphate-protein transferase SoFic [Chlamydiae bacterium]|nr:Adenosine monophosphate-protein transferase SoFic [Chlamydiota bacterium]